MPTSFNGVLKRFLGGRPVSLGLAAATRIRTWGYEEDEGLFLLDLEEAGDPGCAHIVAGGYGPMDDARLLVYELTLALAEEVVALLEESRTTLLVPLRPFAPIVATPEVAGRLPAQWPLARVCLSAEELCAALVGVEEEQELVDFADFLRWLGE